MKLTRSTIFVSVVVVVLGGCDLVRAASDEAPEPKNLLDDFIMAIINNFKDVIINGNECSGLPPLDPLLISALPINITSPVFKMVGNVTNIISEGLKTLEATKVASNLITLKMDMAFDMPEFYVGGNYDVSGLALLLFPIYGRGPFTVRVGGLKIEGGGQMAVNLAGELSLKALDFNVSLTEIHAQFEGLLGGDLGDVIIEIVNSLALDVFNAVWRILRETLMSTLLTFVNAQLEGIKLGDIIGGIIQPPGGGDQPCGSTTSTTTAPIFN